MSSIYLTLILIKTIVKEIEPITMSPSIQEPSHRSLQDTALGKSASYRSNRKEVLNLGPMPPSSDTDAIVDYIMAHGNEHLTEEQHAAVNRHHSLHYHGVEDRTY